MAAGCEERFETFARDHLAGQEALLDGGENHPLSLSLQLREAGLSNWWLPEEYGGFNTSMSKNVNIVASLSYHDAGFAFGSFLSILGTTMIDQFASQALAAQVLKDLGRSGAPCAVLASEASAGSDLTLTETTYAERGGTLKITGRKLFSTNTAEARFLVVLARNADDRTEFRAIVIPRDTPGVAVGRRWDFLGVKGSATYEVSLDGVEVASENVLNGNGIRVLEVGLNLSRTLIAACGIGIGRRVRDLCMDYASTKEVNGRPLDQNDVFSAKMGQIEADIAVMLSQCRAAAAEIDSALSLDRGKGEGSPLYRIGTLRSALVAKMHCGRSSWNIATVGSEMFGGSGYERTHPVNKLLRDARFIGLVEGGEDVTRSLIYSRFVRPSARRL